MLTVQEMVSIDAQCVPLAASGMAGRVYLIGYSLQEFAVSAFGTFGIALPPVIERSVRKRQAEFFFGRVAARRALRRFGMEGVEVGIGSQREPLWPGSLVGSITHNHCYAAAIAVPADCARGIGIDVESVIVPSMLEAVMTTAVSPAELRAIRRQAVDLDLDVLLTLLFSVKESFYKAAFNNVRAFLDFDSISVEHIDMESGTMRLRIHQALGDRLYAGRMLTAHFKMIDQRTVLTACRISS